MIDRPNTGLDHLLLSPLWNSNVLIDLFINISK